MLAFLNSGLLFQSLALFKFGGSFKSKVPLLLNPSKFHHRNFRASEWKIRGKKLNAAKVIIFRFS